MRVRSRSPRTGFTLVEVMVALVLVTVGLLGVAGSSTLMRRSVTRHARELRAVRLATLRLEQLAAAGCAGARGGTNPPSPQGLRESWSVGLPAGATLLVTDSIAWDSEGHLRTLVVRSAILC